IAYIAMAKSSFLEPLFQNPKEEPGFFSLLSMSWMNRLLKTGYQRPLNDDDLYDLSSDNKAEHIADQTNDAWEEEVIAAKKQKRRPRLWKALLNVFPCQHYVFILLLKISAESLTIFKAVLLWLYLKMLGEGFHQTYYTILVVTSFSVVLLLSLLSSNHHKYQSLVVGMRLKVALIGYIHQKILRTRRYILSQVKLGHIQNLVSNDVDKIERLVKVSTCLIAAPFVIVASIISLWMLVGWQSLSGTFFMLVPLAFTAVMAKQFTKLRRAQALLTDKRLNIVHEIISGIRAVKAFAWEENYTNMVKTVRRKAYVSQIPWIFSGSIRDNIVFGKTYDEVRYQRILDVCELQEDIKRFPKGDLSMIGQRALVFLYYCRYLLRNSREICRLESIRRSPVYAHISETERGLEVIRSLQMEEKFTTKMHRLLDDYTKALFLRFSMNQWLALRLDFVCSMFAIVVAILGVVAITDEALTGMLLTVIIGVIGLINYGIRMACEVENYMTSAERILAYSCLPPEPGYSRQSLPPDTWPDHGMISLQNVSLQYIENGVTVLQNLNLEVRPKEKVGIVGRTGAGKSSLFAAILRMPEPQGKVIIDGVDLGTINIQAARKSMAVISQDPVLFAGTLKRNLDPCDRFAEEEIWTALAQVQLGDKIAMLPDQLEYRVGESGTGFSVGERQLLCLARALLQRCRILLMDEATANVDFKTDQFIQHTIRNKFTNCTVLTIAHRLNTIMDYDKILRTRRYILSQVKLGHVQNLVSNDVEKIEQLVKMSTCLISAPFVIVASIISLWMLVGWQSLSGTFFILVPLAITAVMAKQFTKLRRAQALLTDKRLNTVHEIISGIRAVKAFAWEENYTNMVKTVRREEARFVFLKSLFYAINTTLTMSADAITTLIAITTMIYSGVQLFSSQIFTLTTIFADLNLVMNYNVDYGFRIVQEAMISLERIEQFLYGRELWHLTDDDTQTTEIISDNNSQEQNTHNTDKYVILVNLSAAWNNDEPNILHNISIQATHNELTIITGPVGSAKTSLLMAIQGEIPLSTGTLSVQGKKAYVSQIPWIFSGSIRDNIVFGKTYDEVRYQRILDVCELQEDIKRFPKGDLSMIGQRGIMLSGGQRARVSLARAVYSDADIFLLDDPLSAVDAKVGQRIFDKCICGELSGRLRVLVTHQLQYLHGANCIVVMKDGYVDFQGSYKELKDSDTMQLDVSTEEVIKGKDAIDDDEVVEPNEQQNVCNEEANDFTEVEEDRTVGHVSWQVYWSFFRASSHSIALLLFIIFYLFVQAFLYSPNLLQSRLAHMSHNQQASPITIGTYVGLVMGAMVLCGIRDFLAYYLTIRSSINLHTRMTESVIKSPVLFFDTNPLGRIMNRFSSDTGNLDDNLPRRIDCALAFSMKAFGAAFVALFVNLWFIVVLIPLSLVFLYYCRYLLRNSREICRLESIRRSPVYAHISETERGLEVIRSLQMEQKFTTKMHRLLDDYTKALFLRFSMNQWLALRLDFVCSMFAIVVAILGVVAITDEALTGMLLTVIIGVIGLINYGIRMACEVENYMTSAERILAYSCLPPEPGYSRQSLPPDTWPDHGMISLQNVSLQYIENGVTVLQNLNFEVRPKEKVGIIGRTGAGKSSLFAAILRMPEPQGKVIIDGVDLGTINIQAARKSMAVISQDPVLFAGTLKRNLDPCHRFAEEEIWTALAQVQLGDKIAMLPDQLEYRVGESGTGFSVGERQLLCLARALLQRCRILLMDEATANVDFKTDQFIQHTIRNKFTNCTVLTIAHRLNTIMDYDKVVVMDQGHVVEQALVFLYYCRYLLRNSREICRLESIRRSPVYAHISETERGLEVIRSLQMEEKFTEKMHRLLNDYTKPSFLRLSMTQWFALRLDFAFALFIIVVAIFGVVAINDEALTGMLLTVTIGVIGLINFGVSMACGVENYMTSAERILAYSCLPPEPGYSRQSLPPDTWPDHGMISLQNVSLQYIENGVTVLQNLNLEVRPNEKVGIVGRTGAGKSSLFAAILRMPEPKGKVIIDGVDLGTINIQAARRSMAVISQDPVLFAGTLKRNFDPCHRFADDEIWTALAQVQLGDKIAMLPDQLEYRVGESGTGFSVGERQLLCLARALLQRCRILLMDEATANVDFKTDQFIQHTIRNKFTNCTVLTIAHRLNTIMDYDKIVVMDQGHVVEQ
ncbi:hypothetical protein QZH41_019291, partial [Actinostola sp. cb2023]